MQFTAKKSLGQNFLQDEEVARWIADQVEPDGAPFVVEIGPGQGALTHYLQGRAKHLVLVEKDDLLADALRIRFKDRSDVELRREDATRVDMRPWYKQGDVRVVGNLPYSVGSEILRVLTTPPTPVTCAVFMLQKEVCERLAATIDSDSYGALSILVQADWKVEFLRVVGPEVFIPRPRVDSAVIRLTPRTPGSLPVYDRAIFHRLVRAGFSQRRKQLKNLLPEVPHGGWEPLASALKASPTTRAEELTLPQWVDMARWYEGRKEADKGQKATEMFDVVNEKNEVIGQKPRGEVHATGLRHRAVHVFVFNKHGDVYLQKRSHLKDVHPLVWESSAAGHLDVGETYADCAIREGKEELGIDLPTTTKAAEIPATERTGMEFVELHVAKHNGPMRYAPDEIDCGEWFKPVMVSEWIAARPQDFATGFIECWHAWQAQGGHGAI